MAKKIHGILEHAAVSSIKSKFWALGGDADMSEDDQLETPTTKEFINEAM